MPSKPYNPLEGERASFVFKLQEQGSEEKISIIVVHNNRANHLNICLQTLSINSPHNNYEIIVVDNGSDQESQDYLDELEQGGVKVIRNKENFYWSRAANIGAKASSKDAKYLVFLHHDVCILNPLWLDVMINVACAKKAGLVGFGMKKYEIGTQTIPFIDDYCMLIRKDCWVDCGPFREELPQEGSSFIFNLIANRKGYPPQAISQNIDMGNYVHHFKTCAIDTSEFEELAEKASGVMSKIIAEVQAS